MTNESIIIIYLISALFVSALCLLILKSRRNASMHPYFLLLSSCLLVWAFMNSMYFIIPDPEAALFFHELKFIGTAFTPVTLLVFMVKYMRMERIFPVGTVALICLIPIATVLLAATNQHHHLFRGELYILTENPRVNYRVQGIWFWIHTIYSYVLILVSMLLVIFRIRKTPVIFRMPLMVMLLGVSACMLGNALMVFMKVVLPVDISLVAFSISMIFIYWSIMNSNISDYIALAHDEIINTLESAIFILDQNHAIVSVNRAAEKICTQINVPWKAGQTIDNLLEQFQKGGAKYLEGRWSDNADLSIPTEGQNSIYSISEQAFTDRRRMKAGSVVTLQNITKIRRLIHSLELTAGFDPLTGIYNRLSYEEYLARFDTPEHLPLAVIIGDVNNLKEVNDDFGHGEGDELLRAATEVMSDNVPANGVSFRIGGDEFAILIPNCTLDAARQVIEKIRVDAAAKNGCSYAVSIALGCACKSDAVQDLRAVIQQADQEMYADKAANPNRRPRRTK